MKRVLTLVVVVAVLLMGTFAMAEEIPESLDETNEFSEGENLEAPVDGGPTPCGGGDGAGPGGAPG